MNLVDLSECFCYYHPNLSLSLIVAVADLIRRIIMVRDNLLTLSGWFTRDDINLSLIHI